MFILFIFILSACSHASFKSESKTAEKSVKAAFEEKAKKPNKKSGNIEFYVPFGYEIKDKTPNNIILKNGSKTYILFVNPKEDSSSEVVYQATIDQYKNWDAKEKFTGDERFGFLAIKQAEKNLNEVTVGVGGAKMTTQVKTSSMAEEAETMMQIVRSVQY